MTTATKRKAYVREMKSNWWTKLGFYKFYMLRESTAIPTVWFSLVLLFAVIAIAHGTFTTDFVTFLKNPLVIILNLISLAAMILHAKTLFEMMQPVMGIMVDGKYLPQATMVKALWIVLAVVTVVILALAFVL